MATTFDKALAAFIGSILAMIAALGFTVPAFFNGPIWTTVTTVVLPSIVPFILTWFAKNKTA